jgi:tetratricopeptide (TPR) repeat protein
MFPPQRILVTLLFRGAPIYTSYTDDEGKFVFNSLLPNQYRVAVNDAQFNPVDEVVIVNPLIATNTTVRIILTRKEKKAEENQTEAPGSNPYLVSPADYNRQFPKKAIKEFESGVKSDQDGKPGDAERHYQKALEIAPGYYPAHNNLGSLYLRRRDFAAAQKEFQRVLELNQNDAAGYFNLGNLYLLTEHYEDAERYVSEGLRKQPNSAFGHLLEGTLCSKTGKYEEAERELQGATQLDGSMASPRLELVNLYLRQQRKADAIAQLRTFLRLFPADPAAPQAQLVLNRLSPSQTAHFK